MQSDGDLDLLAARKIHDGYRSGDSERILAIHDDPSAVGIVGEVLASSRTPALVADIGVLAVNEHAVGNIADRNLADDSRRRSPRSITPRVLTAFSTT